MTSMQMVSMRGDGSSYSSLALRGLPRISCWVRRVVLAEAATGMESADDDRRNRGFGSAETAESLLVVRAGVRLLFFFRWIRFLSC